MYRWNGWTVSSIFAKPGRALNSRSTKRPRTKACVLKDSLDMNIGRLLELSSNKRSMRKTSKLQHEGPAAVLHQKALLHLQVARKNGREDWQVFTILASIDENEVCIFERFM